MKRLLIIYNPYSSRFSDVKKDVLDKTKSLQGYIIGKYEVQPTDLDDNAIRFSKILKDDDLVISAGGDATSAIAANGILLSKKDVTLAALPYGNFNDLAKTLRTNSFEDIFSQSSSTKKLYPLDIIVDGDHFRYATCYVTIGMTAEAVKIFNQPKMRKKLKSHFGRSISSYSNLVSWYFKNRHKKQFIPQFTLNGEKKSPKTTDYAAVNGRRMARVMKGREDYLKPKVFRSETDRLANFYRLFKLMCRSILSHIPGAETKGDIIEFFSPATIELQAEGESKVFKDIHKIEIRKSDQWIKIIQN